MLYVMNLTIAANTLATNPATRECSPKESSIEHVWISLPASDKVGVRLLERQARFAPAPASTDEWIIGHTAARKVEWLEERELGGPPYRIMLEAYNTDGANAQTVSVEIEISRDAIRALLKQIADAMTKLAKALAAFVESKAPPPAASS